MATTASSDPTTPGKHDAHPVHGGTFAHSAPVPAAPAAPTPLRTPVSRLGPEENFPEDLTVLGPADLQVLRSRITRQLDHDWFTDPAGPHCSTMDRHQERQAELDARDIA